MLLTLHFQLSHYGELRFSQAGTLLAGWGRLGLHVWDGTNGMRLWSYSLQQRAVSAHYSLDMALECHCRKESALHI